jgi:DNA polymerase III subunit epsilon
MDFTAIDFETANRKWSSICSVGITEVKGGKILNREYFLVKPTPNEYDPRFTFLHGISDKDTRNKKNFGQLWQELKPLIENKVLVAYNASFDFGALRYALDQFKLNYPDLDYHCIMRLAKITLNLPDYHLNKVAKHFGISLDHHHAGSDADACALIAVKLCAAYKTSSVETLSKKLGYSKGQIYSKSRSYSPFSNQ